MTYKEFCNLKGNDPMENIFPKGTEPDEALTILEQTFTGHITCAPYSVIIESIINACKKHHKIDYNTIRGINDPKEAIDVIQKELLGEDWYVSYPCGFSQYATEVVGTILYKYGPKEKVPFLTRIRNFFK